MNWKIWSYILFLITIVLIWNYRFDLRKGKLKFILYTLSSCIALPFGVYAFSTILFNWIKTKDIVGTPNCSLEGYPLCFLGHSIFFVVLIFLFSVWSVLAWNDFVNKRLEPKPTVEGESKPIFIRVYHDPRLIDKNWIALPGLIVFLIGIWLGIF